MKTNKEIIGEALATITDSRLKRSPYCIHSWEDVKNDIDHDNLNILDKILFASKEMSELGINSFQCNHKVLDPIMRDIFNLGSAYHDFTFWVAGCKYGFSSRIPRIIVTCIYNSYIRSCHYYIGEVAPTKNTSDDVYFDANEEQIQKVYEYMLSLINETRERIAKANKGISVEGMYDLALDHINKNLTAENKYVCEKSYGKRLNDAEATTALVIMRKGYRENSIFTQAGSILVGINTNGTYYVKVRTLGCGEYTDTLDEWNDDKYKECLEHGVYFMTH